MIHDQIKTELKTAMLEKNQTKLAVVRGLLAAFINELVAIRRKPDEKLADEEAIAVIRREARKRRDSIAQFQTGGREDLVEQEQAELTYLQSYLPPRPSREEIRKIAATKMKELGITEKADAGKLVGAVMKELKGAADGGEVKAVAEEMLY